MRESLAGFTVLLLKVGKPLIKLVPKLFTVLVKFLKGASGTKLALGVASFGAYSVLVDWRFAVALLLCIGIHESGHVWAMRRMGMATRGFYFIPLIGGAAVPDSAFPSAYAEGYIALMGPIWGLFVSAVTYAMFLATGQHVFEVAACWMAFINLINCIPLYPLDGGRVVRSIVQSVRGRAGTIAVLGASAVAAAFCVWQGYWLFAIIGLAGIGEERQRRRQQKQGTEEWAHDRAIMDTAVRNLARLLGLPEDATFDRVQLAIQQFRKHPEWRVDLAEFRALRLEFGRAILAHEKLSQRWSKQYGSTYSGPSPPSVYDVLRRSTEPVRQLVGTHCDVLPEEELQRLDRCVEDLRAATRRAGELVMSLRRRTAVLAEHHGVAVKPFVYRQRFGVSDQFDPATLGAVVFFTAEPFAGEGPRDFGISYIALEDEMRRDEEWGARDVRLRRTYRENWSNSASDFLVMLVGNDRVRGEFAEQYMRSRPPEEWGMPPMRLAAVLSIAILLAGTLFGLMAATGGHETARGAVEFFKKF